MGMKIPPTQYCFSNISITEPRIFMKFHVVINLSVSFKFNEDPCTNACAGVVNARVLSHFAYFHNLSIKVQPNFKNYVKPVEACGN